MEQEEEDLYHKAAGILKKIKKKQGTVKTLIYSSGFKNLRQMFALVTECLKFESVLEEVAVKCPRSFLQEPTVDGNLEVAIILLYEHLLGRKFGRDVYYRKLLQQYKGEIKACVDTVLSKLGVKTIQEACLTKGQAALPKIPRYMRVNLIKSSVDSAIESLVSEGWQFVGRFEQDKFSAQALALSSWQFGLDPILPDLLVFPPDTDLHDHGMTRTGLLVQQDRASCVPAYVLSPKKGSTVVDCCAAPGNKTSHLASLMQDQGRVVALDRDFKRLNTMQRLVSNSGATCLELVHQDFLTVRPDSTDASDVKFILVDPSCSGSGMLNSLTNNSRSEMEDSRIETLKRFQISILKHALRFPNTERVVYSTCSVHQQENEEVAEEVMSQVKGHFKFSKVLPEWEGSRGLQQFPHADFYLRLSPIRDLTQGFFVACFERVKPSTKENGTRVDTELVFSGCEGKIPKQRERRCNTSDSGTGRKNAVMETPLKVAALSERDETSKVRREKSKKKKGREKLEEPKYTDVNVANNNVYQADSSNQLFNKEEATPVDETVDTRVQPLKKKKRKHSNSEKESYCEGSYHVTQKISDDKSSREKKKKKKGDEVEEMNNTDVELCSEKDGSNKGKKKSNGKSKHKKNKDQK